MHAAFARKKTVVVTGAAGVMGARLASRLARAGWMVRGLVLPGDPLRARLQGLGCELVEADIRDPAALRGVCDGIDTVYHLAAIIISHDPLAFRRVNRDGTANVLAEAARANVRHFIYVSSASVTYPRRTLYAESKLEAERLVMGERALLYTIVRPTLVYDEGGGQEMRMFLDYLRRFSVVPFIGAGRALKRPVWSEDIADGLFRLAGKDVACGKIYNFSGGESISMIELARLLLEHHGMKKRFVRVPVPLCRALAHLLPLVMKKPPLTTNAIAGVIHHANLDPADAMRDLGYRPIGVREGFRRCFSPQEGNLR